MLDPITMATVSTLTEAGVAAGAEAAASSTALTVAEVGGVLEAADGVVVGAEVGSTEAFVESLDFDAAEFGKEVLSRAESTGARLSEELANAGAELPQVAKPAIEVRPGSTAFDAARWSEWLPPAGERVMPGDIAQRFGPLHNSSNLESYARSLAQRDAGFAKELARRQEQFQSAKLPAERDAALQQLRRSTAGSLGEAVAKDGLAPFFKKVETQNQVVTWTGVTKVDLRLVGAKEPMILGHTRGVGKGSSLGVEVKVGADSSLVSQLRHAANLQVQGHQALGDKSLVMVSRDIHSMDAERAARDTLAEAGSYVMALLPEKRTIDEVLLTLVRGGWKQP